MKPRTLHTFIFSAIVGYAAFMTWLHYADAANFDKLLSFCGA